MTRTKLGILGLCAMVFGLMAFSATAAQAETGAEWLFAEKAPNSGLIKWLEAGLGLEADGETFVLHSEILKIQVLFLCTTIETENANLLANGSIGKELNGEGKPVGAKVKFSGCTTDLNGTPNANCVPTDKVGGAGTVITNVGHALLLLHDLGGGANDKFVAVLPDTGETFATIEMGAACPIGTKVPVIGKLALKDCLGDEAVHLVKHLVVPTSTNGTALTELWTISKTTEHKASLLGSAWAFLTGANHVGLKFSGKWA